jgi:hypothetical protein
MMILDRTSKIMAPMAPSDNFVVVAVILLSFRPVTIATLGLVDWEVVLVRKVDVPKISGAAVTDDSRDVNELEPELAEFSSAFLHVSNWVL